MISSASTLSPPREAGVFHTRPRMVELVLDLAGYLPDSLMPYPGIDCGGKMP